MHWASWQDFFAMGGYALYVWGSVGLCFIAVIVELGGLAARWRGIRASISRMAALKKGTP
ncbi:MAG: hypothetical protein RL748_865 [Pseudomonadota bacterium]